jgi:hypothetical protein
MVVIISCLLIIGIIYLITRGVRSIWEEFQIPMFEKELSYSREEVSKLLEENRKLNDIVKDNAIRYHNELGTTFENHFLLRTPRNVGDFAASIDGWRHKKITVKFVLDKRKKEMIDALRVVLDDIALTVRDGDKYVD